MVGVRQSCPGREEQGKGTGRGGRETGSNKCRKLTGPGRGKCGQNQDSSFFGHHDYEI